MDDIKTQTIRLNKKQKNINDKKKYSIPLNDNNLKDFVGLTDITGFEYKLFLKLWKT